MPNDSQETLNPVDHFAKLVEKEQEEDFLQKKMIEIFCGIDIKEVDQYKYTAVKKISKILSEMLQQKPKLKTRFHYKGKELGFIPRIEDLSFGEFVDLDMLMKLISQFHSAIILEQIFSFSFFKNPFIVKKIFYCYYYTFFN